MMSLIMDTNCFASRFYQWNVDFGGLPIQIHTDTKKKRTEIIRCSNASLKFHRSVYVNLTLNLIFKYIFKYFVKSTNSFWDYSNDWINNDLALYFFLSSFHMPCCSKRPPSLIFFSSNIYFLWINKILPLTIWLREIREKHQTIVISSTIQLVPDTWYKASLTWRQWS